MKTAYTLGCMALLMRSFVMADDTSKVLFDFTGADAAREWQTVNDGVMGGVSEGKFKITEQKTLEFFGTLLLENNGGFASERTKAKKLTLEKGDTLIARVRGDGREYSLNHYLNKPLVAFAYRATVQTKKDEWVEVKVPLDKFEATSFGRPVKDAGAVRGYPKRNGLFSGCHGHGFAWPCFCCSEDTATQSRDRGTQVETLT